MRILTGAICSLPNRSTGLTPNLIMLGREVRQPMDLVFDLKGNDGPNEQLHQYVRNLKDNMVWVHTIAHDNIGSAQHQQKKYYRENKTSFDEGDIIYKLNKAPIAGLSKKLQAVWKGPLLVT